MKTLKMRKPALFSFEECLWFLNRNYDDCLHHIEPGQLSKAICINGENIAFTLRADEQHLLVDLNHGGGDNFPEAALIQYIMEWFDLDRDITPFYGLLEKNKTLGYMAKDFAGFRLISIHDLYEALCWSIIGQQINLTFAYTLKRRMVEQYGQKLEVNGQSLYIFPRPEVLQYATVADLRKQQFSERKAEYLLLVSKMFAEGSISQEMVRQCASYEAQVALLTAIRGIGIWTANYALMKTLKQLQAIPYGDVGLLNALLNHALIKDKKDTVGIDKLFKRFKGWESYLVFYLWRSLSSKS
ncbi:DNA-3-methyladenine glycosylase family protein [Paraflavitalea soli]|nr:DNA-3-methyladenine glycosylase 2 family protein [Paraflavitalea soli]